MKKTLLAFLLLPALLLAEETPKWTLQQCIDYAMEHSPSLERQKLSTNSQTLQTVIEKAAFDWSISASDNYTFASPDNNNSATIGLQKDFQNGFKFRTTATGSETEHNDYKSTTVAFQISKQILGGGTALETKYNLKASELDELISQNTLKRAQRRLILDVTLAYYTIIRAQQSLTVKQRALENAKQNLLITKEREKPLDILTAELRIPNNELSVNSAKRTIANGLDSLKELIGYDVAKPLEITGEFTYKVQTIVPENDLEFASDNLETIINNRLEKQKYDMLVKIREFQKLPDVTLSATHRQHGDGDGYNLDGKDDQVLGVSFNWTIGRNADIARYEIAQNNLARNNSEYFTLCQELSANISSYKRRLDEYARAVELQELQCNLIKRQEELYRDKWENGEIDILELVRTQTDLENSYVDLSDSKINYLELLANYMFLIGK